MLSHQHRGRIHGRRDGGAERGALETFHIIICDNGTAVPVAVHDVVRVV